MAREWQPAPSVGLTEQNGLPAASDRVGGPVALQRLDTTWSLDRGAVLWEGTVDLLGSFPGFALRGGQAQSVHLCLTDRFLLVDEPSDRGFGLPIGWLTAVQALTGVEPIALESGDRLRVCYVDGNRVRGFMVRVRGGRFGRNAARRANQLRSAATSLGLASPTPSTDLLLPPEHDLSLDWDDFAAHEHEPVIWTGRATMPVASGLQPAGCDVWLTDTSLIWGATARAGIFRLATATLTGITVAGTPGGDPIVYWSVGGTHHTQVDLPMTFTRLDRAGRDADPHRSLLAVLEEHGYRLDVPATAPQPWRTTPHLIHRSATVTDRPSVVKRVPGATDATTGHDQTVPENLAPSQPVEGNRRLLPDDGLFPERTVPSLPRSRPLPWGDRVERPEEEPRTGPVPTDDPGEGGAPRETSQPTTADVADPGRVRIWPSATPRRAAMPSGIDSTAMPVQRPPVRATTTEEFLAAERKARELAARAPVAIAPSPHPAPAPTPGRGVMVRFRGPGSGPTVPGPESGSTMGGMAIGTTPPSANPVPPARLAPDLDGIAPTPDGQIITNAVLTGPDSSPPRLDDGEQSASPGRPMSPGPNETLVRSPAPGDPDPQIPDPAAADGPALEELDGPAAPIATGTGSGSAAPDDTALDRMRSILVRMDERLALAIAGINDPDRHTVVAATPPLALLLRSAMTELDRAVGDGHLSAQAAQTHRLAITRSADTTERLGSLLDLYARGYLTPAELSTRRESLLGRI
ncbi:MAG: hypothetical protein AVDCRST_MAG33-3042 [uncultured Thermomicrobiales bacterium]|uniref:Uncharacterized protein n=1 Tax=uncultured Thermomicrobiales bacterium TaxID=1645740 RepID=A0A6J4VK37_9BACT|nr:MAG: hypothetical protein AVDCRST_MAG33-3042 [uncultured Thermomicrobiales bacterium]